MMDCGNLRRRGARLHRRESERRNRRRLVKRASRRQGNLLDGVADFSETGRQGAEALRQVSPGSSRAMGACWARGKLRFAAGRLKTAGRTTRGNSGHGDGRRRALRADARRVFEHPQSMSVTVLMCAAFIFAILMAYRRWLTKRLRQRPRPRADGRQQLSPAFDEGQQRGGWLHGLL